MNPRSSKFVIKFFLLFTLVFSLFSNASFTPTVQALEQSALPVEKVLKPDGTLDLSVGHNGNLDFTNFAVSLNPVLGPTFKPLAAVNAWNALGATPLSANVYTIVINGSDIYVGGGFQNAGGVAEADFIAKFSGGSWSALGTTPLTNAVKSIVISGSDIYAGGFFQNAGGVAEADYIAKFSGGSWSALGVTPLNGNVHTVAISGSDIYAGGEFTNAGGVLQADAIAKFSGGVWSALGGTNLSGTVYTIAISGSDIYAGGQFINAGGVGAADFIAKFSGGSWSALGATPMNGFVYAIAVSGSDVYAGGSFTNAGGVAEADKIAKFSGGSWSALGATPLNDDVLAITISSGSDVYAGGRFINAGGVAEADKIAKFSGGSWSALGATALNERVETIAISGLDLYAGGAFLNAGGLAEADFIARFITATFADVPTNAFAWAQIESIYAAGVTGGCSQSPKNYCPTGTVTRAQMAVFLMKGINGSAYSPPPATGTVFNDVPANSFAASYIEAFSAEGITGGCGNGNYCPSGLVTRAQMAVFLLKAKHGSGYTPPSASGTMFNDVPSNSFAAAWIEQLANEGITGGCGGGNYCPNASVTRAQMAVFLQKTFNLTLP